MMSKASKSFLVFMCVTILLGGSQAAYSENPKEQSQRYILTFSDDADSERESSELKSKGIKVEKTFKYAFKGLVGQFTDTQIENLKKNPKFLSADLDGPVYASAFTSTPVVDGPTPAVASWGLDRINQRNLPLDSKYSYQYNGAGVTAYVIDTGLNSEHSEFTGRVIGGNTQIFDGNGTNDCNGHGTHVAGTVGGSMYGVARAVDIVPVRVLGCDGSGSLSGVIGGIDWVIAHHQSGSLAVANLSLGGSYYAPLNTAISNLVADGVVVAVAAGNNNKNACNYSPASAPAAITVGATTQSDYRSSYSNFGSCLDIFAPGSLIPSSWIGSTTATTTISGTSMASPHVAGVAALLLEQYSSYTPQQIRDLMVNSATSGKVLSAGTGSINKLLVTGTADYVSTPPSPQTITFTQPAAMAVGDPNQPLSASSTSSLTVSFTTNNTAICTIVSGNTLRAVGQGSCTVTATQAGNTAFAPATPVDRIVLISPAPISEPSPQTITFTQPAAMAVGDPNQPLSASSTSSLTVSFTTNNTAICTIVSGNTLRAVGQGSCTVTATQAGNTAFAPATPVDRIVLISPAPISEPSPQTITFTQPAAMAVGDPNQPLSASSTSSLTVSFTTNNTAICTIVSGNTLRAVGQGSCTVTATQAGNTAFAPATPVDRIVLISPAPISEPSPQTITFTQPAAMAVGDPNQPLSASSTSSLTVSFTTNNTAICTIVSGNTLRAVGQGSCTVTATQAGNTAFAPATPVQRILQIATVPAPPTVSTSIQKGSKGQLTVNIRGVNALGNPPIATYSLNLYTSNTSTGPLTFVGTIQIAFTSLDMTVNIIGLISRQFYAVTATANNSVGPSTVSAMSNRRQVG